MKQYRLCIFALNLVSVADYFEYSLVKKAVSKFAVLMLSILLYQINNLLHYVWKKGHVTPVSFVNWH